jgi:hypothetical protein
MQLETQLDLDQGTLERLEQQTDLLKRTYAAELSKDPASHATRSSRSNLIALGHTVNQVYGEAAARDLNTIPHSPEESARADV